jgi:hypothetical protein
MALSASAFACSTAGVPDIAKQSRHVRRKAGKFDLSNMADCSKLNEN